MERGANRQCPASGTVGARGLAKRRASGQGGADHGGGQDEDEDEDEARWSSPRRVEMAWPG